MIKERPPLLFYNSPFMLQLSSLAVFFAFLHMLIALPAIFAPDEMRKAVLKLFAKPTYIRLLAMVNFVLAYLILEVQPVIGKNWESVMAVLGYLFVIRGVVWVWWPAFVKSKVKHMIKKENAPVIVGLVTLALSLFVGYLGFYVY